ncbi:MAG: hypothetical protein Fur0035_05890 [Anaerolineales bacterium]
MPIPTLLFGVFLACAYGAGFHLWRGGSLGRLALYLFLALTGFWLGELLGWQMDWTFGAIGILNVGAASLGAALFLFVGDFLSRIQITK